MWLPRAALARELIGAGHAVRGTTRDPARAGEIEAAGVRGGRSGDPDVIATLARSLDHVSVACVLLGSAVGSKEQLAALHGTRLEMLLTRMVDTTVRGIVYETSGSVQAAVLEAGAARVRERCDDARIPYALLRADPGDVEAWTVAAVSAVNSALDGGPGRPR